MQSLQLANENKQEQKRHAGREREREEERKAQETFNWTQTKRFKLFWFYSLGGSSTLSALVKSDADFPLPRCVFHRMHSVLQNLVLNHKKHIVILFMG
jgi:hypothetical protein